MQALVTILLAAALLAALAQAAQRAVAGERPMPAPETVAALVFALVVVGLGVGRIGDVSDRLRSADLPATVPPVFGVDDDPLVAAGLDPAFVQFAATKIGVDEHFVVVCAAACDDTKRYLITYKLTPRVPELEVAKADWVVFLGVNPAQSAVPAMQLVDQQTYGDGLAVARLVGTTP